MVCRDNTRLHLTDDHLWRAVLQVVPQEWAFQLTQNHHHVHLASNDSYIIADYLIVYASLPRRWTKNQYLVHIYWCSFAGERLFDWRLLPKHHHEQLLIAGQLGTSLPLSLHGEQDKILCPLGARLLHNWASYGLVRSFIPIPRGVCEAN